MGLAIRGHSPCRYQLLVAANDGEDPAAEHYITGLLKDLSDLSVLVRSNTDRPPRVPPLTENEIAAMPNIIQGKLMLFFFLNVYAQTTAKLEEELHFY